MNKANAYIDFITIPTYGLLKDDLNPIFDKNLNPYPYTLQNHRSGKRTTIRYEAVVLENTYLKIAILPALGGRVYSAFDKRSKKEIFYKNPVIKPRMIGTRGAWFSGGVEFNFPISHSPTTMDRVNYSLKEYEDGSASVIFGNIEHLSGMNWGVELKLYPEKAYLEESVSLYNPTPYENRYYFWTNAAIEFNKSIELIYPFDWCINNLEKEYIKWPYYKGVDFSRAKNIPHTYETFGKLFRNNFFGIYNHDEDTGVVHYADRKLLKGAKFFHWGNDSMGMTWNKALTDDDSTYIETQSGLFETQSVYRFLKPYQEVKWCEYWYPIFGMKGFKHAEKGMAANYKQTDQGIEFIIFSNEEFNQCNIIFTVMDKEYRKTRHFSPSNPVCVVFDPIENINEDTDFEFDIYQGAIHLLHIESVQKASKGLDIDLFEDSRIVREEEERKKLYKYALDQESLGEMAKAAEAYRENLVHHPDCTLTLNHLGRILLKSMLYNEARDCFERVLRYDNLNSEARYQLAITAKETGDIETAFELMTDIASDAVYYKASVIELAKLYIIMGKYKEALSLLDISDCCENSHIIFLTCICYRKKGMLEKARELFCRRYYDEYLLAERFLLESPDECRNDFLSYTNGDESVLLNVALMYADLALFNEAKTILALGLNSGMKRRFLKFYLDRELNLPGRLPLSYALEASLDHVFINEKIIIRILQEYQEKDESGKIGYLLGTFYYSVGRKEDALDCFLAAYEKGLRYTVLLRNMGYIYYHFKKDYGHATRYFEEDISLNEGSNADSIFLLDSIYKQQDDLEARKRLIIPMQKVVNRSLILPALVELLNDMENYEEALAILTNEEFENWEGKEQSGPLYRKVIIKAAFRELEKGNLQKAKDYIERVHIYPPGLNYGESPKRPMSEVYYYKGCIYSLLGDEQAARTEFGKGRDELNSTIVAHNIESRNYCMKCIEELKRNGRSASLHDYLQENKL